MPDSEQLSPDAFLDLVKKAKAKGMTPMALGVGDRPYPGRLLTHEALLKKLGAEDYGKLLTGKLAWNDPRVVDTLKWLSAWSTPGLLPTSFTSLKLGEAHTYFHTNPGAVMFLNGSWYTSRAFNPPDKGGQPEGLPARHHEVPGGARRRLQRVPDAGGQRQLRRQRRHEAPGGDRVLQLVWRPRSATAGSRAPGPDRDQERPVQDDGGPNAEYFKMLAATKRARSTHSARRSRHAGQGARGLHPGDQQRVPGRHHLGRGGGEAGRPPSDARPNAQRLRDQHLALEPPASAEFILACRPRPGPGRRPTPVCRRPWGTIFAFLLPALTLYRPSPPTPSSARSGTASTRCCRAATSSSASRTTPRWQATRSSGARCATRIVWACASPLLEVPLALLLALALYAKVPGARFFRVAWFTPVLMSYVVVGIFGCGSTTTTGGR